MDIHDLRTLRLLEAIDRQRSPSQRDLAKTLGVSLGLVNSFVRRLAKKGYFKITHLPRNRIGYILTPKGAAEKTRLTYAYIRLSYRFYRDARRKISELYQALEAANNRQIVFFGTGDLAEIAFMSLRETTIELVAIADMVRVGESFLGHKIIGPGELQQLSFDALIITEENTDEQTYQKIVESSVDARKILTF